jgi:hypothetical protein
VFSPEFLHGLRASAFCTAQAWEEARINAHDQVAHCASSHEELLRACYVAGAPCRAETSSEEELLACLNVVGSAPPEPVEGEELDHDEELMWRRTD